MDMDPYMKEIVDAAAVERVLLLVAVAAPLVAVAIGAVAGARSCGSRLGAAKGLSVGALGPLCYGLWHLYSYLVRYDPATGYVGLHRVSVLALNVGIFIAVGAVLGVLYSRIFPGSGGAPAERAGGETE
jgi:hypothetical protein